MESEDKKILEESLELAKENNKMLHKVRGVQKRQAIFSVLKWLVIISIALGSYYLLEPYINNVLKFVKDSSASINQLKNLGNTFQNNLPR